MFDSFAPPHLILILYRLSLKLPRLCFNLFVSFLLIMILVRKYYPRFVLNHDSKLKWQYPPIWSSRLASFSEELYYIHYYLLCSRFNLTVSSCSNSCLRTLVINVQIDRLPEPFAPIFDFNFFTVALLNILFS